MFFFHGYTKFLPKDRQKIVTKGKTRDEGRAATAQRTQALREAGFRVIEKRECEFRKTHEPLPEKRTRSYPHAIIYDFESYQDKTQRQQPTPDLVYENAHVQISVSLGETLQKTPTHISDRDPKSLVRWFMAELERREAPTFERA